MRTTKLTMLILTLGLLGLPMLASAHGDGPYGYVPRPYAYSPPPAWGYAPQPAYGPRPFFAKPYPYGHDRRYGGYYGPPRGEWCPPHRRDYGGGWYGRQGGYGGPPRSGISFYYSE